MARPHAAVGRSLEPARPRSIEGVRVALVHDWLTGMRGGEKCLEQFCQLFPRADLYTLIHRRGSVSPAIEARRVRTSPLQYVPGIFRHYRKLLPVMPAAASTWRTGEVDLVISLSHCVAKAVRVPRGVPHVCYCFTPMRYAWDGREAYLESWSERPIRRALAGAALDRLREWDRATAAGVSRFIAISRTVQERIERCYGRESRVIVPPVDTAFYTAKPGLQRGDFYLCVSALVAYKRIEQAAAACERLGRRLIVIGEGPERARLEREAGPRVTFLGWQSDEVIRDHYRRCRALLFPGEEDFGIVPAEALACGAPVIALGRGGAAETVDERVGTLYSEPTAESLVSGIMRFEARETFHGDLARRRAEAFAPEVFRSRVVRFLMEVLGSSTPVMHAPVGLVDGRARVS